MSDTAFEAEEKEETWSSIIVSLEIDWHMSSTMSVVKRVGLLSAHSYRQTFAIKLTVSFPNSEKEKIKKVLAFKKVKDCKK